MTLVLKPHVASQMHEMKSSRLYFLWKDVLQSVVVIIEVILMILFFFFPSCYRVTYLMRLNYLIYATLSVVSKT